MFECMPFMSKMLVQKQSLNEVLKCNDKTYAYQLVLTEEDAKLLVDTRNEVLKEVERIELGAGIINKLIMAFCDSPYISQYNYAQTISELIDTFYYYKNETLDEISDDDLIDLMKELFNGKCYGAMELLQGKELDRIAHNIRFGMAVEADEEGGEEDE